MAAPYTIEQLDLKAGLKTWTQGKGISITRFAEDMKYIYQHAWNILSGSAPVTVEVVGRFVLTYGAEQAGYLLALSGADAEELKAKWEAAQSANRADVVILSETVES